MANPSQACSCLSRRFWLVRGGPFRRNHQRHDGQDHRNYSPWKGLPPALARPLVRPHPGSIERTNGAKRPSANVVCCRTADDNRFGYGAWVRPRINSTMQRSQQHHSSSEASGWQDLNLRPLDPQSRERCSHVCAGVHFVLTTPQVRALFDRECTPTDTRGKRPDLGPTGAQTGARAECPCKARTR